MPLPQGFRIGTAAAGFRKPGRDDVGLIVSDAPATLAAVFTTNVFKAAPVLVCREILDCGRPVRAVLVNTGQANACMGDEGLRRCRATVAFVATATGLHEADILPMSTGVIGAHLKLDLWQEAVPPLVANLGLGTVESFARSMMTTDAFPKFVERELALSGGTVRLVGMAKGAGMICPNMATMLAVVLCDAVVDKDLWQNMFAVAIESTFNRVSVDGDTSTNDTVLGLANGASGVTISDNDAISLATALEDVLGQLAYMLVQDGEGATKVIHIKVTGAADAMDAEKVARTVGHSQLVKTAMYGRDANWGRIVAAVGRSGARFDPQRVRVGICGVEIFCDGQPTGNHDEALRGPLSGRDITVDIELGTDKSGGNGAYTLLASDLTHEYVTCNAAYRT